MPQKAQQQWNPVQAFHAKWPDTGLSDQEILTNLQNPAKFRSAFPEYTGVTDDEIHARMTAYMPKSTATIPTSFTAPVTDTVSQFHPGFWDRVRASLPVIDRIERGLSGPAQTNEGALAKPAPGLMDERTIAPEQALTPQERQAHPILTGTGEVAGSMTTPENMLLMGTSGAMGALPGMAGRVVPRVASGVFAAQTLRGAYSEYPAFRQAVDQKNWPEAERIGTHLVLGTIMAGLGLKHAISGEPATGGRVGPKDELLTGPDEKDFSPQGTASASGKYARLQQAGEEFAKLKRQNSSKQAIETNGVGLANTIRHDMLTHVEALRADGARTIDDAIQADKAALMNTNRGSISTTGAVAEAIKAITNTDYTLKPVEKTLLNRLINQPELTLDEAKHVRTAIGRAMVNAGNRNDAAGNAVFTAAYDQLGEGMKARIQELQGTTRPYEHYNNQFKTSFDLEKNGVSKEMLQPLRGDADESVPKLKQFADANLKEIQQQMRKMGLHAQADSLARAQRDARILVNAHDVANGKYSGGVYRLFQQNPRESWPGIAVLLAGYRMKLPFPLPQIAGAIAAAKHLQTRALAGAGQVGAELQTNLPEESFRTRPQAEEPETFTYKNPDEGWNTPPAPTESLSPQGKAEAVKAAKTDRTSAIPASERTSPPAESSGGTTSGLPADLRGSKPRYGYGNKLFTLKFEDPHDLALYTVAQESQNKAHGRFMSWLKNEYPGKSESELISMGRDVRARIKANARDADPDAGPLTVPAGETLTLQQRVAAIKAARRRH